MMKSNTYWEDRANKRMASYHKNSDEVIYKINKSYDKAIEDINEDIQKIFNKFQVDSGLEPTEAMDILNGYVEDVELNEIRLKINKIKDPDIKKQLWAKLNSRAYRARITRLEALKESIYINLKRVADVETTLSTLGYINSINDSYYKTIYDIQKGTGIGFEFASMDINTVENILKSNWSGKHYSARIWHNTDVLANKLEEVVLSGLVSGKSSSKMASELEYLSDYGKHAAERLIRTETTYITNMAQNESYRECDIEKYVFVAKLDLKTSDICREHDGKIYDVDKAIPGQNLPPLHVYCRSTTISYTNKEWYEQLQRSAVDPETGESYVIPKNITYKEWYQKYVVEKYGPQKAETLDKMIRNKRADKRQFKKYQGVLGKEAPKTLKEFQELKYNNSEEWEKVKSLYRDVSWQIESQKDIVKDSVHTVPFQAEPNSVFDNYKNGKLESRRYYGKTGKPRLDIDLTNHGNSKEHRVVPHYHDWYEIDNEKVKRDSKHDKGLTKAHKIANKDILKGDD